MINTKLTLEYDLETEKDQIMLLISSIDYACALHQIRERMYQIKKNYPSLTEREEGFIDEVIQMVDNAPMDYLK